MNKKINKFLLAGDKFIPGMHLRQSGFTYSVWWTFAKNKERIQKLKEGSDLQYIYQNELDKCCFQHDMTYRDCKDLPKVLRNKAFNFAKNWKYDGYRRDLASIVYELFEKMTSGGAVKSETISNQQLAQKNYRT